MVRCSPAGAGREPHFLGKPIGGEFGHQFRLQHLDRHSPPERRLDGREHGGHSTDPDLALDVIGRA